MCFQLLAGAAVSDLTPQKQNALHLAAAHDHASICSILLENGIDYDQLDETWSNGRFQNEANILSVTLQSFIGTYVVYEIHCTCT